MALSHPKLTFLTLCFSLPSLLLSLSADCVSLCHLVGSQPARTMLRSAMQKMTKRGVPGMCVLHHLQSTAPWKSLLWVGVSHCVRVGGGVSYLEQSSALSWCEWWWGWWAGKRWPQSPPKWCPWWTAARWPDPAGSTYTPTTTHRRTQNILISTKHRLGLVVFTETSDKCDWLQKWTQTNHPYVSHFHHHTSVNSNHMKWTSVRTESQIWWLWTLRNRQQSNSELQSYVFDWVSWSA